MLPKRSISPLIATILLIVVSVILVTVILTWGSDFAKENLSTTNTISELSKSNVSDFIWFDQLIGRKVLVKNLSDSPVVISAYKIILSPTHKLHNYYNNKLIYFDSPITLVANTSTIIPIECLPDRSFDVDLITDSNKYINIKIKNQLLDDYFMCGLSGYWPLNEETGSLVYDISKYNNHGSLINNVDRVELPFGKVLSFNGVDHAVQIPFLDIFKDVTNNDLSVAFWFNSRDLTGYSIYTRFFAATHDSQNFVQVDIPTTGKIQFVVMSEGVRYRTQQSISLNTDEWYFLVGTWNSQNKTAKIFIDGIDTTSPCSGVTSPTMANTFYLGRRSNSSAGFYNGLLYDVRVYDRVLTEEEISNLYNKTNIVFN